MNDQQPFDRHAGIGLPTVRTSDAQAHRIMRTAQRKMALAIANHAARIRQSAKTAIAVTVDRYENELDRLTPEHRQHVIAELVSATDQLLEQHLAQLREVFQI